MSLYSVSGLYSHLSLVVNVVEVLSDTWLRALALDVCCGVSVGDVTGARAAQTSAAESRNPEEQHDQTQTRRMVIIRNEHVKRGSN